MGRKRRNQIYQYFIYNEDNKTSKCKVDGCGQILKGNHGANLLRHFFNQHKIQYETIEKLNTIEKENIPPNVEDKSNIARILENCVELVTVHGRPITLIEDEAFKNIIKLIPGMKDSNIASINVKRIKTLINDKAYSVRKNIFEELKNRLVSLKVDVASLKSRRFLGLNVQYILNDSIVLRNIGVVELHQRNTSIFLKECVTFTLSRYGMTPQQLYSITTDNGANMLSMCKKIDEAARETPEFSENDEIEMDCDSNEHYQQCIDGLEFELNNFEHVISTKVTAVRCAAHTLQLAVRDALNEHDCLDECRRIVKALRAPNYALLLRNNNYLQPIIDCPTRWDSTADMLERLIMLKSFCLNNNTNDLILQEETWLAIETIIKCLTPCRVLSKILQKEQLSFGCFYIGWMQCMLEIEKMNTPFALLLGICMRQRQTTLLENDCFLNAIYLDPRVNAILSDEQVKVAQKNLQHVYNRLIHLSSKSTEANIPQNTEPQPSTSSVTDVDIFLQEKFNRRRSRDQSIINDQLQFSNNLAAFLKQPQLPSNANIFSFWRERKIIDPQLYLLANVVLATPPTQVSVERLFSSLKFVVNNLRISLKDTMIDDILVVRNNFLYNK